MQIPNYKFCKVQYLGNMSKLFLCNQYHLLTEALHMGVINHWPFRPLRLKSEATLVIESLHYPPWHEKYRSTQYISDTFNLIIQSLRLKAVALNVWRFKCSIKGLKVHLIVI